MLLAMNLYYVLPLIVGLSVVLQGTFNRGMAFQYGLSTAVLFNAAVFGLFCVLLYAIARYAPNSLPEFLQIKSSESSFQWKYILPGFCGFLIVLSIPWSLVKIGPANTFVLAVAAQIVLGLVVESIDQQSLPGIMKLSGAALVLVGGIIVSMN